MSSEPIDSGNPYAAPQAVVADAAAPATDAFYVVSARKFTLLFFMTGGVYQVYWFYRHWRHYRAHSGEAMLPIMRALFSIFFTHSLTRRIDDVIRHGVHHHRWSPSVIATLVVILQLVSNGLERMAARSFGSPTTDVLSLLSLLPLGGALWVIQSAANIACGDPQGRRNANLTAANYAWIALGALFWAFALVGLLAPETIVIEEAATQAP